MTNVLVLETYADAYRDALLGEFHDLEVQVANSPTDPAVDFGKVNVLIAFGMGVTDALFTRMPALQWVQSLATGVDHFLRSKTLPAGVILTSGRGIHGPAMRETVLASGGLLVEGRFAPQHREHAYSALVEALRKLLRQVAASAPADRARWRTQLVTALGADVQLAIEALPELEWITGVQPPAQPPTGLAAQQRLGEVFVDLLALLAGPDHPLVLFLDDWQWADAASLAFVRTLMRQRRGSHLLLLGTYQEEAVDAEHPLTRLLGELRSSQPPPTEIGLQPLWIEEVAALIDDSCFHISELRELSAWVMQQSQGNPRTTRQVLKSLANQGQLRFERQTNGWRWTPGDAAVLPKDTLSALWWT